MNADDIKITLRGIPFRDSFKIQVLSDVKNLPTPALITKPNNFECYLINYHEKNTRMGHWLSVCKNNKEIWFYDSMGFSPEFYSSHISNYIKNHRGIKKFRNRKQFQSFSSIVCGGYQILFVYLLHQTQSFRKTLCNMDKMFPHRKDHILNDKILLKFLYKRFKNIGACNKLFCNYYTITKDLCNDICNQ